MSPLGVHANGDKRLAVRVAAETALCEFRDQLDCINAIAMQKAVGLASKAHTSGAPKTGATVGSYLRAVLAALAATPPRGGRASPPADPAAEAARKRAEEAALADAEQAELGWLLPTGYKSPSDDSEAEAYFTDLAGNDARGKALAKEVSALRLGGGAHSIRSLLLQL